MSKRFFLSKIINKTTHFEQLLFSFIFIREERGHVLLSIYVVNCMVLPKGIVTDDTAIRETMFK